MFEFVYPDHSLQLPSNLLNYLQSQIKKTPNLGVFVISAIIHEESFCIYSALIPNRMILVFPPGVVVTVTVISSVKVCGRVIV